MFQYHLCKKTNRWIMNVSSTYSRLRIFTEGVDTIMNYQCFAWLLFQNATTNSLSFWWNKNPGSWIWNSFPMIYVSYQLKKYYRTLLHPCGNRLRLLMFVSDAGSPTRVGWRYTSKSTVESRGHWKTAPKACQPKPSSVWRSRWTELESAKGKFAVVLAYSRGTLVI